MYQTVFKRRYRNKLFLYFLLSFCLKIFERIWFRALRNLNIYVCTYFKTSVKIMFLHNFWLIKDFDIFEWIYFVFCHALLQSLQNIINILEKITRREYDQQRSVWWSWRHGGKPHDELRWSSHIPSGLRVEESAESRRKKQVRLLLYT